ncbi:MAG: integrase arm-type DNA-binding domain-containing protein [Kiloniellales bacterium]|nr:integrase arm-type DNA-binding domain-containing protein [Kiloniellales bacterium]
MARILLTDAVVAEAKPLGRGRLELWDEALSGFGLRVNEGGSKTWQLMYRFEGRKRRMALGAYPALSLDHARDAAIAALRDLGKGRDPAAQRAEVSGGPLSFEAFARAYLERYAKRKKRSWTAEAGMIERDLLPAWGRRPAAGIARRDVIALLEQVMARGHPYAANRRLALIRKMFAWGVEVDLLPATPVAGIRPPAREENRERVLDDDEVAALWPAWTRMGLPFGPLFKLLLLTGQKRSDLAALRLSDIALADQVWRPPPLGKNAARPHELPLSTFAIEILTSMPRSDSLFVFPSRDQPGRHVSGYSKAAERARRLSGVEDWRLQDLRRTAAVGMAGEGASAEVLDQILNVRGFAGAGLRGIYRQARLAEEKRAALEAWGERVRRIVEPALAVGGIAPGAIRPGHSAGQDVHPT